MKTKTIQRQRRKTSSTLVRVVATNPRFGNLCKISIKRLPIANRRAIKIVTDENWHGLQRESTTSSNLATIVVSRLCDIPKQSSRRSPFGANVKYLMFVENYPVEAIASRLMPLGIRSSQRLHLARETKDDAIENLVVRILSGAVRQNIEPIIADAWIEDDTLELLSPRFERMSIPLEKLKSRIGADPETAAAFEIDVDGSFLHWPHADVHLGWEHFQRLIDPVALLRAEQKNEEFNQRYGAAIRAVREAGDLAQTGIPGLTDRNLRRVEHGQIPATRATLEALASAHRMNLEDYLDKVAQNVPSK